MCHEEFFPNFIKALPCADIPIRGLNAYLLQGYAQQVLFMTFDSDVEIPEHAHQAQWGIVLDGEIELLINGKREIYRKGDTYFISEYIPHSARIKSGYKDVTIFNQQDRYKTRKETS
ncbi:MAG: cupin domain-containing protein [Thermodesulfovibrionales bacterium]|jgi:quercetin dioxygenase-like cupin family protein